MPAGRPAIFSCALLAACVWALGCGGGGGAAQLPSPPTPITVSVSPTTADVALGATQQFNATVNNTTNTAVSWSVNGVPGGNSALGTISATGLYTAPQNMPAQATMNVQATSQADSSKIATATVRVTSDVAVSLAPVAADVELGATRQFMARVIGSGNPNQAVTWSVMGPGCMGTACGTIEANGLFTAPQIRPTPPEVTLKATSVADPSKTSSATLAVTSNFTLTVSGPASVDTGARVQFAATLTPAPNSNPSTAVSWSVSGPGCSGTACGTISSVGNYTAPSTAPSPNRVSITAMPAADLGKAASMTVTINVVVSVRVSPTSASVELGKSQPFTATVTGAQDQSVIWDVNGKAGGDQTVGTVTNPVSDPNNTTYTAPINMPTPNQVTVRARSNANPNFLATAAVALFSTIGVQVTPSTATRVINHKQNFAAQVTNTPNQNVQWLVNGVPGGNATVGRICVADADGCQPVSMTKAGNVDYLAPASVPANNPVTISAISQADPSRRGTAEVTILANVQVRVSPAAAMLAPRTIQQFTATAIGTPSQNVTWRVSGAACNGPGAPCGTIDPTGLYTAPLAAPSPNTLNVIATSAEDTSRSGVANVTIAAGANIIALLPASVTAGAVGGFPLKVQGSNFVASGTGPASTIFFNGSARTTTCSSSSECTTTLAAADVAARGSLPVQIQNPDSTTSNQVSLVVVPPATSEDAIPLTAEAPNASGKDIVVVEPTTAGTSTALTDLNLNVVAIGHFSASTNSCVLGGNPVTLARPSSGTSTTDICAFSPGGLDPSLTYTITGPTPNDISIIAKQPLGLGIVRLTLQLGGSTRTGPRTLFVENPNKDKAAASGAVEVK